MRIRTIKPEFWTNEKLSSLPEGSHMFAAALLNYVDDEGYFNAHPGLIRAALYALREPSRSIDEMLEDLASIGYVRFGRGSDGRRYGHIVAFREHQRVDKPTRSKIADLITTWEAPPPGAEATPGPLPESSSNPPGALLESSRQEQGKEQGTGNWIDPPLTPPPAAEAAPQAAGPGKGRRKARKARGGRRGSQEPPAASATGTRVLRRIAELAGPEYPHSPELEERIAEGVPERDLLAVVEARARDAFWRDGVRLRPSMLFAAERWHEHLAAARAPPTTPPPRERRGPAPLPTFGATPGAQRWNRCVRCEGAHLETYSDDEGWVREPHACVGEAEQTRAYA